MYISVLKEIYINHLKCAGIKPSDAETYRNSSLKRRIIKKYGDSILFWPQGGKKSDLICSSSLSAGKLISACMEMKRNMEENFIPVPTYDDSEADNSDDEQSEQKNESEMTNKIIYEAAIRLT